MQQENISLFLILMIFDSFWIYQKIEMLENDSQLKIVYANGVFFEKWVQGLHIQWHLNRFFSGTIGDIQQRLYTTIPMLSVSCSVIRRDFWPNWGFDTMSQSNDWVLNIRIFQHLESRKSFHIFLNLFLLIECMIIIFQKTSKDDKTPERSSGYIYPYGV